MSEHHPRSLRKQRRIADAATRLFRQHGFRRVSVEEICREAGVSKTTFYKHHANKTELVKDILHALSNDAVATFEEIIARDLPFAEKVRLVVDDRIRRTREASDDLIQDLIHVDEDMESYLRPLGDRARQLVVGFIVDGVKRGELRDLEPALVEAMLVKLGELAADEELRKHYSDYAAFTREIVDFFFFGILCEPGRGDV